jgi:predicted nuclease with TOPRIM domain
MTPRHEPVRPAYQRGAVRMVRRFLAPGALELEGRAAWLAEENDSLRARVEELEGRARSAEERLARIDRLAQQVAEIRDGLHEERRLKLRVAELTDLVTELVLPLHDREIDPSVLRSLRPDTL